VKGQFGLGLSIVAKTCDMYGYKVTARNEETGVSFIFTKQ
jgi:two-component system sensor histidine kinase CssS